MSFRVVSLGMFNFWEMFRRSMEISWEFQEVLWDIHAILRVWNGILIGFEWILIKGNRGWFNGITLTYKNHGNSAS